MVCTDECMQYGAILYRHFPETGQLSGTEMTFGGENNREIHLNLLNKMKLINGDTVCL